jgi:hypothetical protein
MPRRVKLETIIHDFLSITLTHPEYTAKTPQYVERENQATIIGYCRAQENLRDFLKTHGTTEAIRALGDVRADGQQKPMKVGDRNLWVM